MKAFKVTHEEMAGCFVVNEKELNCLIGELENANVGEKFGVEIIEMSQEDYDKMPEFDGW